MQTGIIERNEVWYSTTTTYECDALGQLTRVNDPNDTTPTTAGAILPARPGTA